MSGGAGLGFGEAIGVCFQKYAVFQGRAPRSEFWWWRLFAGLVGMAAGLVAGLADTVTGGHALRGFVLMILFLVFILPDLAVAVRRLHDIDRSGWWFLIVLVPFIGWIILLVFYCTRGTAGGNRFGADPLRDF